MSTSYDHSDPNFGLSGVKSELTKREIESLDDITADLVTARQAVEGALLDYCAILDRGRSLRDEIVSRLASNFERKSKRFKNSLNGDEAVYLIASWEELDLDDPASDLDHHKRIEDFIGDNY